LQHALKSFPFTLRAIQVDGGSEFMAEFELACKTLNLAPFVLPPNSPKLNGGAERIHRTHTEEFFDWYDGPIDAASIKAALQEQELIYNTIRPHQSLGLLTPAQFVARWAPQPGEASAVAV